MRLSKLGVRRGMVVYGMDKLDEISLSAPTLVCEFNGADFKTYTIKPQDFGMDPCLKAELVRRHPGGQRGHHARDLLPASRGRCVTPCCSTRARGCTSAARRPPMPMAYNSPPS